MTIIEGIDEGKLEVTGRELKQKRACGGTVKDGAIEIQGDQREKIAQILTAAGFRPVFAGG